MSEESSGVFGQAAMGTTVGGLPQEGTGGPTLKEGEGDSHPQPLSFS